MKIESYIQPKSSFLSMEKDTGIIVNKILQDKRLQRLLYYPTKDCLSQPDLTEEQAIGLFGQQVRIVPRLDVDNLLKNYLIITFNNFRTNYENPQFRDNTIMFDILCHYDTWQLEDFSLRPYKIAGELDFLFNDKRLTGIGKLEFLSATELFLNTEYGGLCLCYQAIHGEEDKKFQPNPKNEQDFLDEFNETYNKK